MYIADNAPSISLQDGPGRQDPYLAVETLAETICEGPSRSNRFSYDTFAIAPVAMNCGGSHMRRREFIALLGGAAAGWPLDVLAGVGHRSAIERTAHFFMELVEQLNLVGPATDIEFKCPLSQYVLADALGLGVIHVNRVLRQLRERGILALRGGSVKIHDLNCLRRLAGFRCAYLNARG